MADKILVVDDDPAICKLLQKTMLSYDMEPITVHSGAEALSRISQEAFDMILMDVVLGDMEGFDVIQKIRSQGITTPVMIVSGRNEDYDMLYGLSLGADDYIPKPFRPHILAAKIKALIRRSKSFLQESNNQLICGPFKYDNTTMRFYKNNQELILSAKESSMLHLFLKHPQQIFTKEIIYEHVWGNTIVVDDNTIMVYVNRLRTKIEENARSPKHIITIRGLGYRFIP